jgi:hypothetical protein
MRSHNKKKHLWVSEQQNQKLKQLKRDLGLNASDVFRTAIDKDYPYINLYFKIATELKKQGTNLNQIARHANTSKKIDEETLKAIEELKSIQKALLLTLRSGYDN